jgi:hypothetical protein
MKRYFRCRIFKRKKAIPEFVNQTPTEVLSPINRFQRPLPDDKEQLQIFDFELVEQIHLLEAESNKNFQEAKYCIAKDDMIKALHYMNRSREIKNRIERLEKRHQEVIRKLEAIITNNQSYQKYVHPIHMQKIRAVKETSPTLH